MASIATSGLTRRFDEILAVDSLDLQLPDAGVVGLVGPNGSGKSTIIRMLLGLIAPSSGAAEVLGAPLSQPSRYLSRVGALVESPAFVPSLSAHANLLSLSRLRGLPDERVDEVLRTVGLAGREHEPARRFSLGMKQRLGIAAALLPDPELLLLDEPTNGLDPAGIIEIRALLRRLGDQGRAVLVSSHLLDEIEVVCDWVVVMRFGRLMFSGPMRELLGHTRRRVEVAPERDEQLGALREVLRRGGWDVGATGTRIAVMAEPGAAAAINREAASAGITLSRLEVRQDSLEDVFLGMTGTDDRSVSPERPATPRGAA